MRQSGSLTKRRAVFLITLFPGVLSGKDFILHPCEQQDQQQSWSGGIYYRTHEKTVNLGIELV
jgi:hypothetical protein